jgi:hypothetical protein
MDDQPVATEGEIQAFVPCFLSGILVASVLAPWDEYFFGNFAFYWLPQAVVLGILMSVYPRPAAISGAAVVLAAYLAAFGAWLFFRSHSHAESLAWLGYLFSLPGAAIGATAGAVFAKRRNFHPAETVGMVVAVPALVGLVLNQTLICSTLMHCSF